MGCLVLWLGNKRHGNYDSGYGCKTTGNHQYLTPAPKKVDDICQVQRLDAVRIDEFVAVSIAIVVLEFHIGIRIVVLFFLF